MRTERKAVAVAIALASAGWLLSALTPSTLVYHSGPEDFLPGLPLVSAPFVPKSDVVSLVPHLYGAFTVAAVSVVLVEVGKVALLSLGRRALVAYLGFCLFQIALGLDTLRRYAVDWYGYLLHYFRIARLSSEVRFPDPLPIPAPYLSMTLLALLSVYLILGVGRENGVAPTQFGARRA
jgi:hypothetical protein